MDFLEYLNRKYEKTPEVQNDGLITWKNAKAIGTSAIKGLKNFGSNVAEGAKGVVRGEFSGSNFKDALLNIVRGDNEKFVKGETGGLLGATQQVIQSPLRAATRGGLSFIEYLTGKKQDIPLNPAGRALFGLPQDKTSIESFQQLVPKQGRVLSDLGATPTESKYLPVAGIIGSAFADFYAGGGAKDPFIKSLTRDLVKDANLGRREIEQNIRTIGLSEDVTRELSDSVNAILDTKWSQGQKQNEIANLIDDVIKRSRSVESGPAKSVVQVVNPRTGENVFYEVSPEDLKVLRNDLIDGTGRGVAGREINGNIFHLTAKTPSEMLERAGWKNGGKKTLDDIVSMITPKKRVAVRTEDGRFAGSFMEDVPAFKLASEKRVAQDSEALTRRSLDDMSEFDMSITEAKSAFRNMFDENEVGFIIREEIKDGKQVGKFSKNFRSLVEVVQRDGKVQSSTLHHEAFHAYFNTFIPAVQRQEILARIKASPSTALSRGVKAFEGYRGADVRAEEWLADDFARYVREVSQNKKPTSIFADVWQKMLRHIRQMIRKANNLDGLYKDILEKRRTGFVDKKSRVLKGSGAEPKMSKTEKEYDSILTSFVGAEKGERIGVTNPDGTFGGYRAKSSTFPQWVPENLRSRELFDKYMDGRTGSLDDFKKKYKEGTLLAKLDDVVRQRLFEETGEDLRIVPDDLYTTDDSLLGTPRTPDPLVKTQTQGQQTGSQMQQSVLTGDSLPQSYTTDAKKAIVDIAERQKEPVKQTVARFEGLKKIKTNILEYVQNTDERVRQMIESGKYEVTDASNIYQKATLASGRMGARIEKMKEEIKTILDDIRTTAQNNGFEYDTFKGDVDDYLIARHAPERNAAIGEGAAGMTTAEAETLMRKLESGSNGAEIKRIADKVQNLNNETLDILLKSQVITEDLHALLRERYQYHVPLYRVQEADVDFGGALTGRGFDVRSTGVKRAKGSDKEIDDVIGNVMYNYEQAIIRSEKNIVDLSVAKFIDDNGLKKGDIMHRTQLPFVPVGVATHKGQVFHEVMDKVNELVTKYGGTHERKLRSGKAFGYYQPAGNKIVTRFGTSKDTLIHEFGHMLDTHFGMRESDFFTKDISEELRAIADLRDSADPAVVAQRTKSRERYVRSGPEKIAEFISTYFSDMETARRVAPKATEKFTRFLDDKPELRELSNVMKSRARSEEIMQETLFAQQKFTNDPQILTFRENGKASYIKINDKNLAVAIRGVGREKLGGLLNVVRAFTNFYSGLHTRFNPDFALPNKIRDLQETITYLAAQKDLKASTIAKVGMKDPKSIKDVIAALRGQDTEGARLYNEMKEAGGTTGGMGLSTREQTGLDMKKMDKLMNSKTRRTTEKLIEYVDNWNTIFEDSTRLSVYREARAQGLSKERAAFLAKEASINFNRMGKGGPVINALWMFSNASIQGSTKMLRALKNPKVLAGVVTTVGVSVAAVNEWNDSVDPEWREKVPKWDRMNSLPVVLPSEEDGKFNYFAIPVSWGIKPIKVMADYATDAMSGHAKSAKDMTLGFLTSVVEGYNPVGGTDLNSALMPTVLDTPYEIARNMSWSGAKITPTNYNNAPDDTLYFSSLPETQVGRTAISLSELLTKGGIEVSPANMKYAYEQYVGGAGRFVTRLFNTVSGAVSGDQVPLDEYPFIARFYRERSGDELEATKSTETQQLDNLQDDDAREKKKLSVEASRIKEEIMALPTAEEKKARLKEVSTANPELAKKVLDFIEDDKAGLTPQESQLKNSTVKVRAEYIRMELNKLTTSNEKKAYLKDLKAKKILTASVMDELGL